MKRIEPQAVPQKARKPSQEVKGNEPPAPPAGKREMGAVGPIAGIQHHFMKDNVMKKIAAHCGTDVNGVEKIVRDLVNVVRQDMQKEGGKLALCSPASFVNCIYDAYALKMRIDVRQQAYLVPVPVKNAKQEIVGWEAQVRPGYKGYLNRLEANLEGFDIRDGLVWGGDAFESWNDNGNDFYRHTPEKQFRDDVHLIVGSYCYITYWVHGEKRSVMTRLTKKEIDTIRGKAKTDKIWQEWFSEKVLVATIRRACKRHFARITDDLDVADNEEFDLDGGGADTPSHADKLQQKMKSEKYNPFPGEDATVIDGTATEVKEEPTAGESSASAGARPTGEAPAKVMEWGGEIVIGGKAVEREFNSFLQAYNYLAQEITRHGNPAVREGILRENAAFLTCAPMRERPELAEELRLLALPPENKDNEENNR